MIVDKNIFIRRMYRSRISRSIFVFRISISNDFMHKCDVLYGKLRNFLPKNQSKVSFVQIFFHLQQESVFSKFVFVSDARKMSIIFLRGPHDRRQI